MSAKKSKQTKNINPRSLPPQKPLMPGKGKSRAMEDFPQYFGEETIGGMMPNPEADDDSLASLQEWGFELDADDERPKEINPQKSLDRAEKSRRRKKS